MAKIFFPYFSLKFSKKSLISLTFSYPLTNSTNFPDFLDFPDQVEILSEHENISPFYTALCFLNFKKSVF